MIEIGSTFFSRGDDPHLHIVISNPQENNNKVLIVRVTTFRSARVEDTSCVLLPEDGHPVITRRSVVNYGEIEEPKLYAVRDLETAVNMRLLILQEPFSGEILERILEGARKSPFLRKEFKELIPKR